MSTPPFSAGKDQQYLAPGSPGSVLTSNGPGVNPSWQGGAQGFEKDVIGNYQILPTDRIIQAKGPNSQVITLPSLAQMQAAGIGEGVELTIIAAGDGVPVTVQAPPGTSINRVSSFTLSTRFSAIILEWDGSKYFVKAAYLPSAETILVDEFAVQFDGCFVNRKFPEAIYASSVFMVMGTPEIFLVSKMAGAELLIAIGMRGTQ